MRATSTLESETGYQVFTYVRRVSATLLIRTVQFSSNLGGQWTSLTPAAEAIVLTPLGDGLEQARFALPREKPNWPVCE